MKVTDIKWELYSNSSLDFILNESENLLKETFISFREITNRCYYTLGIYFALIAYCANRIIEKPCEYNIPFYILFIGILFCIGFLFYTLLPEKLTFAGTHPELLLVKGFEQIPPKDQLIEYKIQTIVESNNGFKLNREKINKRLFLFKASIITLLAVLLISFFVYLFQIGA
jgi:hypothetical protein